MSFFLLCIRRPLKKFSLHILFMETLDHLSFSPSSETLTLRDQGAVELATGITLSSGEKEKVPWNIMGKNNLLL